MLYPSDNRMETTLTVQMPASQTSRTSGLEASKSLASHVLGILDENSAQDTIMIDIHGKSSVADFMIVTSGRSNRHVGALADYVIKSLKGLGHKSLGVEGMEACDWVLIDGGDVILHIFRPEVRAFYNLEKIWAVPLPDSLQSLEAQAEE